MADRPVIVEERLTTAQYSFPFRVGWLEATNVTLATRITAVDVKDSPVALIDSIEARSLLRSHVIVRDAAVCSRRASMLTLATHTRPDDIQGATVSLSDVSSAGRAIAAIVIPAFYGITVNSWTTERLPVGPEIMVVQEDTSALIPIEDEETYQEDLGRAWFLYTDAPAVWNVCVARRDLIASDPSIVSEALGRLAESSHIARTRGRELRRDLSRDHGIEREVLTDALADQTLTLGSAEQRGLEELWQRSGTPLSSSDSRGAFVSIRRR